MFEQAPLSLGHVVLYIHSCFGQLSCMEAWGLHAEKLTPKYLGWGLVSQKLAQLASCDQHCLALP